MSNHRSPHVIVLRLAAVLLTLVMVSSSMIAGRYARYTSTATSSDRASVTKYQITVSSSSDNHLTLASDSPAAYTFSVTSGSEVAVEYDLVIILPEALPEGVSLSLTKGDVTTELSSENNQYTVANAGTFGVEGGTHTYTMTFAVEQPVGAGLLDPIAIRVDARQVD